MLHPDVHRAFFKLTKCSLGSACTAVGCFWEPDGEPNRSNLGGGGEGAGGIGWRITVHGEVGESISGVWWDQGGLLVCSWGGLLGPGGGWWKGSER